MKTIWKFRLQVTDVQMLDIPVDAELLSVCEQDGHLCLWALVKPHQMTAARKIAIYGTGNEVPWSAGKYVGTAVMSSGLVWHVFDLGEAARDE